MLPCHRPASSATLSRAVPSSFRQHRSRLRRSNTSCAGGNPLLLPLRLQPLSLLVAVGAPLWPPPLPRRGSSLPPYGVVEPVTGRTPSPSRPPPNLAASASARGPETGDPEMEGTARREMVTAPLPPPEEGRVENLLFRFVCVPPLAAKTSIKEQFPQSLGLKRRRVVYRASRDHFPPPLSPGSWGLPKSNPPAHLWNRVRAVALKPPLQVVIRKPGSCVSPHTRRNQVSVTLHTQTPPPAITGQAFTGPGPGPCVPPRCPTTGTSVTPLVPLARSLGAWLALPSPSRWLLQTIRLGYAIQFARRPPKFRGIRFTSVKPADAPVLHAEIAVLLAKDAIEPVPPADMRSGLFSPYFIVPKKGGGLRPILDLRVLNRALHKLPFIPRLVCSDRPEGRVLSCLDPPATQAIPAFRVRGTGVSVQGPALRAVPVASRLHQSRGGGPCPPERTRCAHSQLPRRLAHTRTVSLAVVCTQGPGAQAPQPAGPSGQLGKEQTRANAEDLFSRHGVRFGQPNSMPHPGTCSVSAELLQDLIRQDGGSTETLSEVPGAYGCSCGDSPARSAPYETASALAQWPNPEVGVETRHLPGSDYTGLPQDLQAVVRSLVPSGRSAPGAGIQTCCAIHRCLDHRLGSHVQRACSIRGLDGSPTALAYQLPRVASSTPCPEPSQRAPSAQGRSGPYGQHCDRCVYQPARWFALPSHVARHLLLWSQKHLRSLRAIHIPGVFNRAADELSRAALPGEWRLHPQAVQLIWSRFGAAQVDLFASPETTHCQEFYSLTETTLGTDALAHSWPRGLRKYAFPPVSLLAQTLCKIREDEEQVLLVAPYWPNRTWFPGMTWNLTS